MHDPNYTDFQTLNSFSIDSGFVSGINTLDFVVQNLGTQPNPTGLLITDLCGTAEPLNVPEPSAAALVFMGILALMMAIHFKSKQHRLNVIRLRNNCRGQSRYGQRH